MKAIFVFVILVCVSYVEGARILIASPLGTKSHKNTYIALTKELAKRGHEVTVICNYHTESFRNIEGISEIVMEHLQTDLSMFPPQFEMAMGNVTMQDIKVIFSVMLSSPMKYTTEFFEDVRIQDLIANSKFDLMILSAISDYMTLPLAWHFKVPIISTSPNVLLPGWSSHLGVVEPTAYVPFVLSSYSDRMNFIERMANTAAYQFFISFSEFSLRGVEDVVQKYLHGCPTSTELNRLPDIIFTNTHPSFTYPRTLPPSVIEIGAIQCEPAKPLPLELEEFVSASPDGFILFSIGSLLPMNEMPEHLMKIFIKVFSNLPQRVIWQWKGTPKYALPANVKSLGWLPQQDLLGHKNCRLFLTHGGLNSIQESIYHGVPVLGFPFGNDQAQNLAHATIAGHALAVKWPDMTEEIISTSIHQLLHNSSFSDSSKRLSLLLRDQNETPLERAIYWTEFAIRHKGAKHLVLASRDLLPHQRALVDVYAAFILIAISPILLMFFCVRLCCRRRRSVDLSKKNQ